MSEDLTLIQRIKSASDIDVRTHGFIYELTDKDGRCTFLHRDVDGVFKPNFTKRLFYYINTSEFDLPLSFKEVPYKAEKIDAEVIFRLQLCPTADFDKDPELANWVASERLDVLRASDVKSRLAGRLGAYFSRIVNGATTLALAEQYGKGAFRDDYSAWNDSGLPSWLYIAKTASADVTRLPTEAEREVQLENERVARAMERTRKVKEQIDIAVSEAQLKEAQDAIAHHMEQLRQRRELENAQYALMLQQVETARERDLRAREIEELEHQIAKGSRRVDLAINYERLKQEQAKTQSIIQDTENKRRHNEAKIAKLNQEIEESKKRVEFFGREHSLLWNLIATGCKWIVAILAILIVGVVVWIWMDKGRGELQRAVNCCQKEYSELKSSYRYVPWRKDSFKNIEDAIRDLNGKLKQPVFSKTEVENAVGRIKILLQEVKALERSRIDSEKEAFDMINPARQKLSDMLDVLPIDFVWGNVSKETLATWSRELERLSADLILTNHIDIGFVRRKTKLCLVWAENDFQKNAKAWFDPEERFAICHELDSFLRSEINVEMMKDLKDRNEEYYRRIVNAYNLYSLKKLYTSEFALLLRRIEKDRESLSGNCELDVQDAQLGEIRNKAIENFKKSIRIRRADLFPKFKLELEKQLDEIEIIIDDYRKHTEVARQKCRNAYQERKWDELYGQACSLKNDKDFRHEGEVWEEVAKWGLRNRSCSNVLFIVEKECKTVMVAYENGDTSLLNSSEQRKAIEAFAVLFGKGMPFERGPDKARMEQIQSAIGKLPLPEIQQYLFGREIYSFLNGGSIDDLNWIYEQTNDPDILFRYIRMFLQGKCGKRKDPNRVQQLLRQLENFGGDSSNLARKLTAELRGF